MDTKKLRQKILDLAIRGKLVPQDPNDEPASVLLERIKAEKEQLIKDGKINLKIGRGVNRLTFLLLIIEITQRTQLRLDLFLCL